MATTGRGNSGKISNPKKAAAAAAESSEKALPNYLKPTISSSLSSRRFRSEKPPPPAHPLTNTRTVTQRSFSSLSSRSTNFSRPGRPNISMRRALSAKASPSNSCSSITRAAGKEGPRSVTSESSVDFEGHHKDRVISAEDDTDPCENKDQNAEDDTDPCEKKDQNGPKVEDESSDTTPCENKEHPVVVVVMEEEEEVEEKEETEAEVDEKHVVVVAAESEEMNEAAAKVKVEMTPSRPANQTQPYNDVIEKTATKLMKGSNKVRALAGAFETVISLQDTTTTTK